MLWLGLAALVVLLAVFGACWWGTTVIFHPPLQGPLTIFPHQFGLEHEDVEFETEDGITLRGWIIPSPTKTKRSIIFCHGWGDDKGDMLDRFRFLHKDFNLFFFDFRSHGNSEGEFSTIGYLESRDFAAALGFLREQRPNWAANLGICGLSMGAAVAIHGMARFKDLKCAVLEAPFRSFTEVVIQFTCNQYSLPYYPFVWLTLIIIRARLGADPEPHSPTYHIRSLAGRPTQFIAGEEDCLMPLDRVRALFEEAEDPKDLWVIPEAAHGRCQEVAGAEYDKRVKLFFDKNI